MPRPSRLAVGGPAGETTDLDADYKLSGHWNACYLQEQDFAEISRRMYEEIRSSRDPRDHVEDG